MSDIAKIMNEFKLGDRVILSEFASRQPSFFKRTDKSRCGTVVGRGKSPDKRPDAVWGPLDRLSYYGTDVNLKIDSTHYS